MATSDAPCSCQIHDAKRGQEKCRETKRNVARCRRAGPRPDRPTPREVSPHTNPDATRFPVRTRECPVPAGDVATVDGQRRRVPSGGSKSPGDGVVSTGPSEVGAMSKRGVPLAPIPWSVVLTAGTEVEQEPAVVAKSHQLHVEGANAKLQTIEETPSGRPGSAPRRPLSASRPWSARSGVTRTDSLPSTLGPDEDDVEEAKGIREEMARIRGLIEAASRGGADAEKVVSPPQAHAQ